MSIDSQNLVEFAKEKLVNTESQEILFKNIRDFSVLAKGVLSLEEQLDFLQKKLPREDFDRVNTIFIDGEKEKYKEILTVNPKDSIANYNLAFIDMVRALKK